MVKLLIRILLLLTTVPFISGVHAGDDKLIVTGSSTMAPLVAEMAKRYELKHPGVRVDVQMGGSSRGILDARMGLSDIGMVSRALKTTEQDLTPALIAFDGIAIILHKSNIVSALSDEQIIAIYNGQIRNWNELGGVDREITVVNKAEGRSTLEVFLHYFSLRNSQIKSQVVIGDNQQGIKTIAANPGAIGYVSIGTADFEETRGTPIKSLPLNGQPATVASVGKGQYPLSRQLNLVFSADPPPQVLDFIAFAQSAEVHDVINSHFFVTP